MQTAARHYERRLLEQWQRDTIEILTKLGGFSNRAIAVRIFGAANPSIQEIASVAGYKSGMGFTSRQWRDMTSVLSVRYANHSVREARRRA